MIELFKNIPPERRETITNVVVNTIFMHKTPLDSAKTLIAYRSLLPKEEQDFLDFFLAFYKEQYKDESNFN